MPRPRLREQPLSSTQRVQRFRSRLGVRRLEVLLDLTTADQTARFATRWNCSQQEVVKIAFLACLPAMKQAASAQEVFDRVRDGLATQGLP